MKLSLINENIEFTNKCDAKFGDCSLEAYKVAKNAITKGTTDFTVIDSMVKVDGKILPHTWINYKGKIIDPTASQFNGEVEYAPVDEYYEELSGLEFVSNFEDEYGDILSNVL